MDSANVLVWMEFVRGAEKCECSGNGSCSVPFCANFEQFLSSSRVFLGGLKKIRRSKLYLHVNITLPVFPRFCRIKNIAIL